ncbi:tetratricopeptide repeat protein [Lachnospiraceae bacterium OttesenSCG-928-D06]|nr:tetratricopeptide repeat protein [Lachnospiraceae bacterium OttesenSCG-928-D06]
MESDFRYLREHYGDAGAREAFEKICTQLFIAMFGNDAHNIKASQGDEGIDIFVGDFNYPGDVYQCKYFIDGVGDSQKKQVRNSFKRAVESKLFKMKVWTLCIPCELTPKEFLWWSKWKNQNAQLHDISINLIDGGYLINQLKKYDLYTATFNDDVQAKLDEITITTKNMEATILEEITEIKRAILEISRFGYNTVLAAENQENTESIQKPDIQYSDEESIKYTELALMFYKEKDYENAIRFYNIAIESAVKRVGDDLIGIGFLYSSLAFSELHVQKYDCAVEHFIQAYSIKEKELPNCPTIAFDLILLGEAYHKKGELEKAEAFLKIAIQVIESRFEELETNWKQKYYSLKGYKAIVSFYFELKEYSKAIKFIDKLKASTAAFFEEDDKTNLRIEVLNLIAEVYYENKLYYKSIPFFELMITLVEEQFDFDQASFFLFYYNKAIGNCYSNNLKFIDSLEYYNKALEYYEIYKNLNMDQNDDLYSDLLLAIGRVYMEQGEYDKALEYFTKDLYILKNHQEYAVMRDLAYQIYLAKGDNAKAMISLQQALSIGINNPQLSFERFYEMAKLHCAMGEYKEAIDILKRILPIAKDIFGNRPKAIEIHTLLGSAYLENGNYISAINIFNIIIESKKTIGYLNSMDFYYCKIACCHCRNGDYKSCIEYILEAISFCQAADYNIEEVGKYYNCIASGYEKMEEYYKGKEYFEKVLKENTNQYGYDHEVTKSAEKWLYEFSSRL